MHTRPQQWTQRHGANVSTPPLPPPPPLRCPLPVARPPLTIRPSRHCITWPSANQAASLASRTGRPQPQLPIHWRQHARARAGGRRGGGGGSGERGEGWRSPFAGGGGGAKGSGGWWLVDGGRLPLSPPPQRTPTAATPIPHSRFRTAPPGRYGNCLGWWGGNPPVADPPTFPTGGVGSGYSASAVASQERETGSGRYDMREPQPVRPQRLQSCTPLHRQAPNTR